MQVPPRDFQASEALVGHIKDDITRALDDNPTFSLVTCGHSLGGGAAALVAHLLSSEMPDGQFVTKSENRDIYCYAIEPAAPMCARASAGSFRLWFTRMILCQR